MSNLIYSTLIKMAPTMPTELDASGLEGDHENLIATDKNSNSVSCHNKAMVNNNSITSFKTDEHQVSIIRSTGRRYSTMCFQASPCKTKVDIIVTQGLFKPEVEAEVFDLNRVNAFVSHSKLPRPRPPWPVKLCLGSIFLLVFAMTIALIVVVSMHGSNNDNITVSSSQPFNQSYDYRAPIIGNNTVTTFLNGTGTEGNDDNYNN